MDAQTILYPLFGGALIGVASALVLLGCGRIAGISGIVAGLLDGKQVGSRAVFVLGLVVSGLVMGGLIPAAFPHEAFGGGLIRMGVAGLLVGYGARLGSGCTSGHGVCGIGRFSRRGLVATATFMATGFLTVFVARHLL